jgi:hypothetical protein
MNVSVSDFGAVGDGSALDTLAIQSAIDHCHRAGGGRVTFPAGYTFLSGSLLIRENIELHLEQGAVLLASGDYGDYHSDHDISVVTEGLVVETVLPRRSFISGYRAHGCSITGAGEINGNADAFILEHGEYIHTMRGPEGGRSQYLERPYTIFLIDSEGVQIRGIRVSDPAFWAMRLTGCHRSVVRNISIHTDLKVPNADGIDIDRCRDVEIVECEIITADDCVSVKSCAGTALYGDAADIRIAGCSFRTRSGAITLGTESVGAIRNVVVEDCVVRDSHRGFAVRAREGGLISNIIFRRCQVQTRAFSPEWWGHGEALHVTAFRWNEPPLLGDGNVERVLFGRVEGILFEDIEVETEAGLVVWAQQKGLISDVTFDRVQIELAPHSSWPHRIDLRPNDVTEMLTRSHNALEIVNADKVSVKSVTLVWPRQDRELYGAPLNSLDSTLEVLDIVEIEPAERS